MRILRNLLFILGLSAVLIGGYFHFSKSHNAFFSSEINVQKELFFDKTKLEKFEKIPELKPDGKEEPQTLNSQKAVIIDLKSEKVLFGKNEREKAPIASITKLMTAIIADEKITDWQVSITVSQKSAQAGGSGISLLAGEVFRADDLFKAMLMNSDNSSAIALAEFIAGDTDKFAQLMNEKARELGAMDTHFVEPTGLEDEVSYSTAFDVALIAKYALAQKKITDTMKIEGPIEISSINTGMAHRVGNTNLFLKEEEYAGLKNRVIGGKTGFTYNAGYCLMMGLKDKSGQEQAIGVVLNSGEQTRWSEIEELFRWSFENYTW